MKKLIIVVGLPAAGKTTQVENYIAQGFVSLSRDRSRYTFDREFTEHLANGTEKIILDNTFYSKESRSVFIVQAANAGYEVTALHIATSFEDAQYNAISRMIRRCGKLLTKPEEYKEIKDPNIFPVAALYRARKAFEKPSKAEGFDEIITVPFVRKPSGYTNKAIILDYDGTLRKTRGTENPWPEDPSHVEILPGRTDRLKEYQTQGYILLGVSNQSWASKDPNGTAKADACFKKTNELLGLDIDYMFCSHAPAPITCYCRKPGSGFGVEFIEKYKLDASQCIMVGDYGTDKTFAARCGFQYMDESEFFK